LDSIQHFRLFEKSGGTPLSGHTLSIPYDHFRLDNGLQVIFHQDAKLPVAHVNLWYHVGSKNERPGKTGFAHLFEHLMFQGSRNADGEYLTFLEKAGANLREGGVNGTTSFDRTNYFETVPAGALEHVLWLESDRMGFLIDAMSREKLDNQREVVKNERRQSYENVPYGRALEIILKNLFPPGHPYSWMVIGSQEDLDNASLEDFKEFFRGFYAPNNCSLAVAGDFDPAQAKGWIGDYFGGLPPGPPLERMQCWIPRLAGEKKVVVADKVPQERVYKIWPVPPYFHPAEAGLDLASRLLSQGKNSRLFKSLVYQRQIASDVSTFNYSLEISGLFGVVATARPGQSIREIESIMDDEIARFGEEGPDEEELERELAKHEFDFVSGLERIGGFGGKADLLNQYNTYLGSPGFFQKDYERYCEVSAEAVRSAVKQYLDPARRLVVNFVPENLAAPQIQGLDRSRVPAAGKRVEFSPEVPRSMQLANGLRVVLAERHEIPKVSMALVVDAGASADPGTLPGTAWMTAAMLDEGTSKRSALEIQKELDRLGSVLQTYAETEISRISVESLRKNMKPSLALMAEIALQPAFPAEELERQRKRRLDSILQERHNPTAIARKIFRSSLFGPEHPLGRGTAGNEESIQALHVEGLQDFYRSYWHAGHATLVLVGDLKQDEALEMAEEFFGAWQRGESSPAKIPSFSHPAAVRLSLIDRPDAPQSQIRLGGLGPGRSTGDYYAIELMNSIFGGAFSSRLNLNLREDKGYTYGAFSHFAFGRELGLWVCGTAVETRHSQAALGEILRELTLIRGEKPVTEEELETARTNLIQGYSQRFETQERLADQITEMLAFGLPLETMSQYVARVEQVTLGEVQNAVSRHLDPERLTGVMVGDLKVFEEALRGLNLGEIHRRDVDGKVLE
jgi:zinc protease